MSDMTEYLFGMGYGGEGLARASRRWNPPTRIRAMSDAHLANAIKYWSARTPAPGYLDALKAEQKRRKTARD